MTFRLFKDYAEDSPLGAVDRRTAGEFLEVISRLHPDYGRSPETKKLSLWKLLENHRVADGGSGLSGRTLNRRATALRPLWTWAIQQGLHDGANPWEKLSRPKAPRSKTRYQEWTVPELQVLLDAVAGEDRAVPVRTPREAFKWFPLIAIYSGLRIDEIASLQVDDIRIEDTIFFFSIHGRVKTEAAMRQVPVHSKLLEAGLVKYRDNVGPGALWPGLAGLTRRPRRTSSRPSPTGAASWA